MDQKLQEAEKTPDSLVSQLWKRAESEQRKILEQSNNPDSLEKTVKAPVNKSNSNFSRKEENLKNKIFGIILHEAVNDKIINKKTAENLIKKIEDEL